MYVWHISTICMSTQSLTNDDSFVQWCDTVVDGREGFEGLERRVGSKAAVVAFAIGRVSVQRIMKIADANQLLPPKVSCQSRQQNASSTAAASQSIVDDYCNLMWRWFSGNVFWPQTTPGTVAPPSALALAWLSDCYSIKSSIELRLQISPLEMGNSLTKYVNDLIVMAEVGGIKATIM